MAGRLIVATILAAGLSTGKAGTAFAAYGDFSEIVSRARPGSTIVAPQGSPLSLRIVNRTFSPAITIRGGTFTGIKIQNGGGIHFENIATARSDPTDASPMVEIVNGQDVEIVGGTLSGNGMAVGVRMRTARNISVRESAFRELSNGLRGIDVDNLTVTGNRFSQVATDGIGLGGVSNVTIDHNTIAYDDTTKLPHPDAIQFWDDKRYPSHDIVIRDNVIDVFAQGIFVKSEMLGGFDRVSILNNDIQTDYQNALTLTNSRDSRIEGNSIRTRTGKMNMAKIILAGNRNLIFNDNKVCKMSDKDNEFKVASKIQLGWQCPDERGFGQPKNERGSEFSEPKPAGGKASGAALPQ